MRIGKIRRTTRFVAVVGLTLFGRAAVLAQAPTTAPPTPVAIPTATATPASALELRLRKLEENNRQILEMYQGMAKQNAELLKRLEATIPKPGVDEEVQAAQGGGGEGGKGTIGGRNPGGSSGGSTGDSLNDGVDGGGTDAVPGNVESGGVSQRARRGVGAQGTDARTFEPEGRYRGSEKVPRRKAIVEFAEGLEFSSADGEFKLQFHDLTQAELRMFTPQTTGLVHDSFFIPRQRWYFTGRVTKNLEYYTVINRGYGALDLLDAFLTYRLDERIRFRIGRMKTPYLYEYYQIAEGDLIAPERSVYAGNLAANRQMGAMFLGELFQNRMGYAVGAFNGTRRSFEDYNNAKDVYVFLNSRPFLKPDGGASTRGAEGTDGRTRPNQAPYEKPNQAVGEGVGQNEEPGILEYLNLGGSWNAGFESGGALQPSAFHTANDQSSSGSAATVNDLSPTFLAFNTNVIENGERMQWAGHVAWYFRSLFVLAEYGAGYGTYSLAKQGGSVRLPYEGYLVQGSYFLTGERITRRVNVVKPLSDFRVRNGKISGTGAVEVYARYSQLGMGHNVFTSGLADPNLWSNQASTVDLGVNWYLNFYTKIYLGWQHAMFGQEVTRGSGLFMRDADLFWLRFQLFF